MTEIQNLLSPPSTSSIQDSPADKTALTNHLDALLEQYLHTLDTYEKLTQQLSSHLSSGFFSLAQANFHNRSGVHYGRDRYDERVRAVRKIVVSVDEKVKFDIVEVQTETQEQTKEESEKQIVEEGKEETGEDIKDEISETPTSDTDSKTPPNPDPIRMFGILVPPALRSAQASFQGALGPLVGLSGVVGELRALEREIGRARKAVRRA